MKTVATKESQPVAEPAKRAIRFIVPEVNIFETKEGWTLQAEMPGVSKEGLQVTLEGNELTLVGNKRVEIPSGQALFRESSQADYRRVFELDPTIDSQKISAQIDQGVLTLQLPKTEQVKPRRIQVTG
jgi:HSP20 family protein